MHRVMYTNASQYVSNRDGVFYYIRRIPYDVRQHYASSRISFSLRTKSLRTAARAASSVTQRLEDYWLGLRLQQMDIPAFHLVKADDVEGNSPLLLDAVEMYLNTKVKTDKTFIRTARRNAASVAKVLGNKPITSYATSEAAQFRDWCFEQGMSLNTVKRVFTAVRSIINLTMREYGIKGTNAFSGTFMPDKPDASPRQPIPNDILKVIQKHCQSTDDEMRWLIALLSDTGMRLSEAAGLLKADIYLCADIPFVDIKPHPWRRLKTRESTRKLPLVGSAFWAAKRASDSSANNFLFPKYCNRNECHSNSASAALNKWLKQIAGGEYVIHSLRHSMRDRLRELSCPPDMINQIGGWANQTTSSQYGQGYSMSKLHSKLLEAILTV
jgi:integrase